MGTSEPRTPVEPNLFHRHARTLNLLSRWVTLVSLLASLPQGYAQYHGMTFRRFGLREGLSQSSVNTMVQDQQGFMWFGTQDGLNRYDGYTFRVFTDDLQDSSSPSDSYIWKLLVARTGELWIGTYNGGLNRFDPATERFATVHLLPESLMTPAARNVTALYEDRDGSLWVGTWGTGLFHVTRDPGGETRSVQYQRIPGDRRSLVDNRVSDILEDRAGTLWVSTWGGISCLAAEARSSSRFVSYLANTRDAHGLSDANVWKIGLDSSGNLWFGTWGGGVCRYERTENGFVRYLHLPGSTKDVAANSVTALYTDAQGVLWLGSSGGGLYRYDASHDTFTQIRHDPYDPESIAGDGILSIEGDRTGGLWVGHEGAGVSYYDPRRDRFLHYRHIAGNAGSLNHDNIRALADDRAGGIWVGMRGGGIDHLAKGVPQFVHYRHRPGVPSSLSSDLVLSVLVRRNGDVLVGTQQGGLNVLAGGSGSFRHFVHDAKNPASINSNSVSALFEDRRGTVWVGTNGGGLDRFDDSRDRFVHYARTAADDGGFNALSIWGIFEDRDGNLWIGTWGMGLVRLAAGTLAVTSLTHDPGDTTSLGNNTVFCVTEDDDGYLWVGTEGGGLNRLDPATLRFKRFTERQGLPNNVVYGILPDGRGNLWLSTNRGLVRFTVRTEEIRIYNIADGLQSNEFNQNAFCRTSDGRLLFGGIGGFNAVDPEHIPRDGPAPAVVLTDFLLFGKRVHLPRAISSTERVELSYDQDIVAFEFVALDFAAPERNQYMYRLDGFDRDWVRGGARRFASYTRLPGGEYVFRVRGSNSDGVWNSTGAAVSITVVPPFWMTWWFRTLVVLTTAGMLLALYRYRVRRLVEIERMRTRIASDLHDDIGSRLTRIAIQSEIIQNTDDPALMRSASSRIGDACRAVITTMSDVIWSIDARNDSWADLLDRMRDYGTEVFAGTSVELTINQKGFDLKQVIPVDVRQNFYLIYKEALSNAARHSNCRRVTVEMDHAKGQVRMEIADDGKGIEPRNRQGGQGLRNMQMRAERIHAHLEIVEHPSVRIVLTVRSRS